MNIPYSFSFTKPSEIPLARVVQWAAVSRVDDEISGEKGLVHLEERLEVWSFLPELELGPLDVVGENAIGVVEAVDHGRFCLKS